MSNVSYQTSIALKEAGLIQPTPAPGQFWYGKRNAGFDAEPGSLCVLIGTETGNLEFVPIDNVRNENNKFFVFAPPVDYIMDKLPIESTLGYWGTDYACSNNSDENPRRTFGETFAEAAAKMCLELKQNESPTSDFSKMGDA